MFTPPIQDKAGRGALCAKIDALVKDLMQHRPDGDCPDGETFHRLTKRLDEARAQFHTLYGFRPDPGRATP